MILGTSKSYIIQGVNTITLNHSITTPEMFQNADKRYTSIINGNKTSTHLGNYAEFKVLVYLWKETNPGAKLASLLALRGQSFDFYLQGTSAVLNCYAELTSPMYFRNLVNYNAVNLLINPLRYIAISQYILDDNYIPILDDNGNKILSDGVTIA